MLNPDTMRFHALLIGIEKYDDGPLSGCINDIDQVESFLIDKLGVPPSCIRRLEAPNDPQSERPVPKERQPTYANIVEALRHLASEDVQRGDRVLIYYSGHGSYEQVLDAESYFEGVVPLDYEEKGLIFDVELNGLLQDIADRSGDLTVILDCCYSAGATRDTAPAQMESKNRFLPVHRAVPAQLQRSSGRQQEFHAAGRARKAPEEYTVIAACHADEVAAECCIPPRVGKPRGLLSYSLFDILSKIEPAALQQLRWSDIWEPLKAAVTGAKPSQHPMLLGPKERRVFGGAWQPQDMGYTVSRSSSGEYLIAAGSLAGLGKGAQIAVYGPEPARFPQLNSQADLQARLGVLVVNEVMPAQATASPSPQEAPPFPVPTAARGRMIRQGMPDLLRIALSQGLDPLVRRLLEDNAKWDRFVLLPEGDPTAECRVGQYPGGDIWIGDGLFGPGAPTDLLAPGPMGRLSRAEIADAEDLAIGLRAGLNHYAQYVIPLRAHRNGGFTLPERAIQIRLLDCAATADPKQMERSSGVHHEVKQDEQRRRYVIASGARVAFHLHNTLATELYVFLMLCNLEGQIEFLDGDVLLNARSGKIFWSNNIIGEPFELVCPKGHAWGIDRLIAIATDQKGMDLRVLNQKRTMNEAMNEAINTKSTKSMAKNPPSLRWSVVQTMIQIGGPNAAG